MVLRVLLPLLVACLFIDACSRQPLPRATPPAIPEVDLSFELRITESQESGEEDPDYFYILVPGDEETTVRLRELPFDETGVRTDKSISGRTLEEGREEFAEVPPGVYRVVMAALSIPIGFEEFVSLQTIKVVEGGAKWQAVTPPSLIVVPFEFTLPESVRKRDYPWLEVIDEADARIRAPLGYCWTPHPLEEEGGVWRGTFSVCVSGDYVVLLKLENSRDRFLARISVAVEDVPERISLTWEPLTKVLPFEAAYEP